MYNFNDSWGVILDDKFKPLVGKIGFYKANTTELKTIKSTDGIVLQNPIMCNGIPSHQVMLDEGDYTVRFWRYIGAGEMDNDFNPQNWVLFKTELIVDGVVVESQEQSEIIVDTIDELKTFPIPEEESLVTVLGYYEVGDCPPRSYMWSSSSELDDDGGVVIKSNLQNTGAWLMKIPGTYIDVRWYGDMPSSDTSCENSNLGQRTKAANAATLYSKDLYFPATEGGTSNGYYGFNGSNTVSVSQNIICDNKVRFVVKENTTGTLVTCKQLIKYGKYLFTNATGESIGSYTLQSDWINTSWLQSVGTASGARQGYVVDEIQNPILFSNTKIKLKVTPTGCTFDNCEFVETYKVISSLVTLKNLEVNTNWFVDTYDWSQLSLVGCKIDLSNCKDANTYILLKNKQNDGNYGDLGEQTISATVYPGIIENCSGTITLGSAGNYEFHNVSLTVNGITSSTEFNAVDSWLTINSPVVISKLDLRRGSINGLGSIQVLQESTLQDSDLSIQINSLGTKLNLMRCKIQANIKGTEIKFHNCELTATVEQIQNSSGLIEVDCCYNKFNVNGQHYIHATVPNSLVEGQWISNTCEYDTEHWIKLNRSNLEKLDWKHKYDYIGNQEPYLEKFSGYKYAMKFALYRGHLGDTERGIFAQYGIPFIWYNSSTNEIFAVNRYTCYWRMFTVGNASTRRMGRVLNSQPIIGIADGSYGSHNVRQAPVVWTWDSGIAIAPGDFVMNAVCLDSDSNDANYVWTFERPYQDHTGSKFSNGVSLGCLGSSPGEPWTIPQVYPQSPDNYWYIHIILDKNIQNRSGEPATVVGWNV